MNINKEICYLCGGKIDREQRKKNKPESPSKDHIPPQTLYKGFDKKELIKLDTHQKCHASMSKDDDEFSQYIIMSSESQIGEKRFDLLMKDYKKNPNHQKYINKFVESPKYIDNEDGLIVPSPIFCLGINNTLWRIIRGLYFRDSCGDNVLKYGTKHILIPSDSNVMASSIMLDPDKSENVSNIKNLSVLSKTEIALESRLSLIKQIERAWEDLNLSKFNRTSNPKIFDYRKQKLHRQTIWELKFYDYTRFIVRVLEDR